MSEDSKKTEQSKKTDIPKRKKKSASQIAKEIEVLERGKRVLELKKAGASFRAIAEKMREEGLTDVSHETVRQDYLAAMTINSKDFRDEAIFLKDLQNERLESLLLANWTVAHGKTYIEVDSNGQPVIDERTNRPKKVVIPPDTEAGRLVLKVIQEISELNQLKPKQTQLTGKGGGPIETLGMNVPMTIDEWRDNVKKRREEAARTMELYAEREKGE